jgi:RimJ/RimL family protein N-acetyltransferase
LKRVVAIVNADNQSSIRVLEKIGFEFEKMIRMSVDAPELKLFAFEY